MNKKTPSLSAACDQLSIPLPVQHNALADCMATLAVMRKMIERIDQRIEQAVARDAEDSGISE